MEPSTGPLSEVVQSGKFGVRRRRMLGGVMLGLAAALSATSAAAQEVCRSRAGPFPLGAVVCLDIPCIGKRMARCDRVLNNTSWTFLDQPCPVASRQTPAPAPTDVADALVLER